MNDLVARWTVPLNDMVHLIEFEHGTLSGKRVIWINKKEIVRREYVFKLVGSEPFRIGTARCVISINLQNEFNYAYTLQVNGKEFEKFIERQTKVLSVWQWSSSLLSYRIVLEKDTMDVWINGRKAETTEEFVDNGTEIHFLVGDNVPAVITTISSGQRRLGLVRTLFVNGSEVPPSRLND